MFFHVFFTVISSCCDRQVPERQPSWCGMGVSVSSPKATFTPLVVLISPMAWNQLSEDDQAIVREAAVNAMARNRAEVEKAIESGLDTLRGQGMTVIENVQMALMSHHRKLFSMMPRAWKLYRDEAFEFLDTVAMADQADRPCSVLAYGDLKRLELAIALTHRPRLLLMDEPTAGMAPSARIELMQLVADIVKDQGVSVLFTEHDMDVVFAHAHHIMVLNRGELIADGSVTEVRNNPQVQEVYLGGGTLFKEEDAHA